MAVFIELVTSIEPDLISKFSGKGKTEVRRPLRVIEIKDDTYAYIKLVRMDGKEVELVDSSSKTGYSTEYANFILQSVQEQRMERHQIIETFGDSYLFIFGEAPRFLQVSAVLINTFDFNWKAEFMYNYDNFLRGTKSLEKGARMYLFYDENVVEGYILNASIMQESQQAPYMVQLQFQVFVTNHRNVSLIQTEGNFPLRSTAVVPDGVDLRQTLDDPTLRNMLESTIGPEESGFANNPIARTRPLRSKTADNADEYTTDIQPVLSGTTAENRDRGSTFFNRNDTTREARHLGSAISKAMEGYGVPQSAAQSPFTARNMGYGPSFLPNGVGMGRPLAPAGTMATFGATPSPGYGGGFAGAGVGFGAGAGFGSFAGAYSGVGIGASNGAFAGMGTYPNQQYANRYGTPYSGPYPYGRGSTYGTSSPLAGNLSAEEVAYALATGNIFSFQNVTGRGVGWQAAYGYPNGGAQSGYHSYSYEQMRAASRAGGYAGAGSYMGYPGYYSYVGASNAGQSGSGAGVYVGGAVSAFSFSSLPGTFTNTDMTTPQAMSAAGPGAPWGPGWSWP